MSVILGRVHGCAVRRHAGHSVSPAVTETGENRLHTCLQPPERAALTAVPDVSVLPLHSWPAPPSVTQGSTTMSEYSSLLNMKPPGHDQAGIWQVIVDCCSCRPARRMVPGRWPARCGPSMPTPSPATVSHLVIAVSATHRRHTAGAFIDGSRCSGDACHAGADRRGVQGSASRAQLLGQSHQSGARRARVKFISDKLQVS